MNKYVQAGAFSVLMIWTCQAFGQVPNICTGTAETISFDAKPRGVYPGYFPARVPPVYLIVRLEAYTSDVYAEKWWENPNNFFLRLQKHKSDGTYADAVSFPFRLETTSTGLVVYLDPAPPDPTRDLKKEDKLSLYVAIPGAKVSGVQRPTECAQGVSNGMTSVTLPDPTGYAASLEPSWVPKQELTNGAKRDVAHLAVDLDFPTLASGKHARLYAKGDQTLSSDGKDPSTKLEGILGAGGRVPGGWLVPWDAEVQMTGDQRLSNASAIVSAGTAFIIPWEWSKPTFWNGAVRAPFSPDFSFSAQHETRLRQDAESKKEFQDTQAFRLYGEMNWSPIHLLTGSKYSQDDISVEFHAKGWYLPNQLNSAGQRIDRLEGLVDVSVLFPLRKFDVVGGLSPSGDQAAKQRIRLNYAHGANDANGFKHYSQLTLGVEVVK